jgi:hypothetical protein
MLKTTPCLPHQPEATRSLQELLLLLPLVLLYQPTAVPLLLQKVHLLLLGVTCMRCCCSSIGRPRAWLLLLNAAALLVVADCSICSAMLMMVAGLNSVLC